MCYSWFVGKVAISLMLCVTVPMVAVSAEVVSESPGVAQAKAVTTKPKNKTAKKGEKRKRGDLRNPERLKEIAEMSILAIHSGDAGAGGNDLELPVNGRISSTVGLRPDPINGQIRMHNGIDIAISEGTPVKPVAPGRVAYSGMQPGYGNMVIIQHDDGMISIYAHHLRNLVRSGERVTKETAVAYSGSTGHSTGPHLHFEAWQAGANVTKAFTPAFAGRKIEASSHVSLDKTNLRKVIMADGTILFVEVVGRKNKKPVAGS